MLYATFGHRRSLYHGCSCVEHASRGVGKLSEQLLNRAARGNPGFGLLIRIDK